MSNGQKTESLKLGLWKAGLGGNKVRGHYWSTWPRQVEKRIMMRGERQK
jgi:hypothetical protein